MSSGRGWLAALVLGAAGFASAWGDVWIVDGVRVGAVAPAAEASYPVLILPLGGQWTDFELKATTNNFEDLCYYIQSSGTNEYTNDTNVWVYFTDDFAGDPLQWRKSAFATPICAQLTNATNSVVGYAVVCPSHECGVDWRGWMAKTNDSLVWSFVRYDGIDLEKNVEGTKARWNAVVPAEWRSGRVAP